MITQDGNVSRNFLRLADLRIWHAIAAIDHGDDPTGYIRGAHAVLERLVAAIDEPRASEGQQAVYTTGNAWLDPNDYKAAWPR